VARNAGEKIPMFVPQISRTEPPKQEPAQRKKISVAWKGAMVVSVAAGCGIQLMMMAVLLNNNQKFVPIVTGPSSTNVVRPSEEEEANKVAREHFRRGDLAMEREDFGAAREQYFQAMQTVSKRDRQYASRSAMMRIIYIEARARADEGDYAAAEAKLLAARALRGNYNESHLDAVSVALRGKQFDTAKEYLKRALPMDSSNRFRELWHVAERNEGNSGPFSGGVDIYLRSLEERRNSDLPSVRDELKQLARKYPKSPTLLLHLYRMAQIYKEPKLLDLVGTANGG
jgi:tetratricopeptide (TPR) repeat protein